MAPVLSEHSDNSLFIIYQLRVCKITSPPHNTKWGNDPNSLSYYPPYNGAPDFTKIRLEHYEPAFLKGIEEQNAEIKAIVDNPEEPTFENTIVALDKSGGILARVKSGAPYSVWNSVKNGFISVFCSHAHITQHVANVNNSLFIICQ